MRFIDRIFRKDQKQRYETVSSRDQVQPPQPETPQQKIRRLWQTARTAGLTPAKRQKAIDACSELLEIISPNDPKNDRGDVLRNRAMYYRMLKKYDQAIEDLQQEMELAQNKKLQDRINMCHKLIEETRQLQRRREITNEGGQKAQLFNDMQSQAQQLWDNKPDSNDAFDWLFQKLQHPDADVRAEASRLLAEPPNSLEKLANIYRNQQRDNPKAASLAGRVLGRKLDINYPNTSPAQVAKLMFGTSLDFLSLPCLHCGFANHAIPIPPNAKELPFRRQLHDKDAEYIVSVICDQCGKEYFLAWDQKPE